MKRWIDVFAYDGTQVAQLKSDILTAVPAGELHVIHLGDVNRCSWRLATVTASHPNIVARAYGANASCVCCCLLLPKLI